MPDRVDAPTPSEMRAELRAYQDRQQQQWRIVTVLTGPVLGAGLGALAIATWRAWRHEPGFLTQPGHWILMIVGTCSIASMHIRLVNRFDGINFFIRAPLIVLMWVTLLLPVYTLAVAYYRIAEPLRWQRVFAIAGWSLGLFLFGGFCCFPLGATPLALLIVPAILYATPISVVVAAVLDVRSGRAYDVFHWAGVVAVPALAAILTGLAILG
jgi:hypothetical protein